MKKHNKGLSIVEMIIAIAIIAVFSGTMIYSASNIPRYRARECSRKITSNLGEVKITSLGKAKTTGDIVWELYKKDGRVYVRTIQDVKSGTPVVAKAMKISKGKPKLGFKTTGSAEVEIPDNKGIMLCFDRATGAMYTCGDGPGYVHDFMDTPTAAYCDVWSGTSQLAEIIVSANGKSFTTTLVGATGKVGD